MMRVITGSAKGTKLKTLEGLQTRPTVERVKEAIFSSLFERVEGTVVADLFAGSGQMGIEALSRGAKQACFAEQNRQAAAVVIDNIKATHLEHKATVSISSVENFIKQSTNKFDLVFMDPPYGKGLIDSTLMLLTEHNVLSENAVIVAESDDIDIVNENVQGLTMFKKAKYGRVVVRYFRNEGI